LIGTSIDVTESRKHEAQILAKNQELSKINSELDNFVYSVSHDLRSPLLSIKGLLSLVMKSPGIEEKLIQYLKLADQSVGRLDETIKEILDYSRNARLKADITEVNLKDSLEQIFTDLRFVDNQQVEFRMDIQGSPIIRTDKTRIQILLKNIIGNSVKYKKANIMDSFVDVNVSRIDDELVIRISDNGEGIPEKHLAKIFEMFYRATHTGVGTGLGLYICREIVNKLGGSIDVQSEYTVGTTVTIKLPQ
jgi:signal transduction histidine kinase